MRWARTDWKAIPVVEWSNGAPSKPETDQDGTPVLYIYASGQLKGIEEGTSSVKMRYEREVRSVSTDAGTKVATSHGQTVEKHIYGEVALRPAGDTSPTLTMMSIAGSDIDIVDVPKDTKLIKYTYAIDEATNLVRVASEITRDASNRIINERRYFYDGPAYQGLAAGNIEKG